MTKTERWLISISSVISLLPIVFTAFAMKLFPKQLPLIEFTNSDATEYSSKYNNLISILFSIVPITVLFVARTVKNRNNNINIMPVLCAGLTLGVLFSSIVLYGIIRQAQNAGITDKFDYIGFICVAVCITIAVLNNVTRYRSFKSKIAINNKYTKSNESIWKSVHNTAASVQSLTFILISIPMAFLKDYIALSVLLSGIAVFMVWCYSYSYMIKTEFDKKATERKYSEIRINK